MAIFNFAPVAPIGILEHIYGPYNLVLAHEVLKHQDRYRRLFERIAKQYPDDAYTIVDNGIIENGTSNGIEELVEAAEIVNANVIVLPDVIRDRDATVIKSAKAVDKLAQMGYNGGVMAVAQGHSPRITVACALDLVAYVPGLNALAIPRPLPRGSGDRGKALKLMAKISDVTWPPVHLLGYSGCKEDDEPPWRRGRIQVLGIDSAEPVWRGVNPELTRRPDDYWEWDINKVTNHYELCYSIIKLQHKRIG